MIDEFFEQLKSQYNIDLNKAQQEVVVHNNGPCLILAVPGGGKTTTLLARTAYLINVVGVKASEILSITFSRASANDMKKRYEGVFAKGLGPSDEKVSFSTIHSFSYRVVMGSAKARGISLKLIEGTDAGRNSKIVILKNLYNKFNREYISDSDLDTLVNDISYVKNMMYDDADIRRYKSDINFFMSIYKEYENIKSEQGFIDFDDMLVGCANILENNLNVRKAYQNKFKYIQVDEAQDTSILQHRIIEYLGEEHKNVFYVADDDQSIYGFRAAHPSYLLNIKEQYPSAKIYKMEENYRSTKAIVKTCNSFIKTNKERYDKEIHTHNDEGVEISIVDVEQRFEQIPRVLDLHKGELRDIAILYRNNHSAIPVVKHLVDKNIPFYLRDFSTRFFSHWVVSDLLNILKFAQEPTDLEAFSKFYYKLRGYYISKQMVDNCSGKPVNERISKSLEDNNILNDYQVDNVVKLERHLYALSMKKPTPGIDYILDTMGYREFLMDRASVSDATYDTYLDMVRVLKNLGGNCKDYMEVIEGINKLKQVMSEASKNQGKNVVTMTTIHSSKGLEWNEVFLIDLQEGVFPNRDIMKEAEEGKLKNLEEERRLFYVGMTRAKNKLHLFNVKEFKQSLFLREVDEILDPAKKNKRERLDQAIENAGVNNSGETYANRVGGKPAYWGTTQTSKTKEYELFEEQSLVSHKSFGDGVVLDCIKDHITIQFEDKTRKLGYGFCMEQNLLKRRPN